MSHSNDSIRKLRVKGKEKEKENVCVLLGLYRVFDDTSLFVCLIDDSIVNKSTNERIDNSIFEFCFSTCL